MWGQQVVVFNQPGAGGAIATRAALTAPPDGTTLFLAASSVFIVLPQLQPGIEVGKLEPIGFVNEQPMVFAATPALPVKTVPFSSLTTVLAQSWMAWREMMLR